MQVWLSALASASALHPLECNSSVLALCGQKDRIIAAGLIRDSKCRFYKSTMLPPFYQTLLTVQKVAVQANIFYHSLRNIKDHLQTLHSCASNVWSRVGYNVPLYSYGHVWLTCSTCSWPQTWGEHKQLRNAFLDVELQSFITSSQRRILGRLRWHVDYSVQGQRWAIVWPSKDQERYQLLWT